MSRDSVILKNSKVLHFLCNLQISIRVNSHSVLVYHVLTELHSAYNEKKVGNRIYRWGSLFQQQRFISAFISNTSDLKTQQNNDRRL